MPAKIKQGRYIDGEGVQQDVVFIGAEKAIFDDEGNRLDEKLESRSKASGLTVEDTEGILGVPEANVNFQALVDAVASKIMNELVTDSALTSKLADYVTKAMLSNSQVNDQNMVPTSALAYAMNQAITENADAITQLNGNTLSVNNKNAVSVPQNADMMSDTYKQPGIYVCEATSTFDTLQNCPVDGVFKLTVEEILGKNSRYILQTFERHEGSMVCKRVWSPYSTGTWGKAYKYITDHGLKTATITSEATTIQPNASIGVSVPTNNPVGFKPLFASIGDTSVKGVFPRSCMITTETQVTVYLDNTTSLAVEVSLRINVLYIKI